jgi:peptidoglycan/LPS O-acetylase OafA/YrhL
MTTLRSAAPVSRRAALAVLGACIVLLAAMWIYAASLDHWSDAQEILFTVGPFVLGLLGLGALALLVADVVRERRPRV